MLIVKGSESPYISKEMCTLILPYIYHFKQICGDVYLEVWDVNLKFSRMYIICCIMVETPLTRVTSPALSE